MFEEALARLRTDLETAEQIAFQQGDDLSQVPFVELDRSTETNLGADRCVELNEVQMRCFNDSELVEVNQYLVVHT